MIYPLLNIYIQALRACDGNEALAANMLLDGGMFEDDDEA